MDMYSEVEFQKEFQNYAIKHLGVSSTQFYAWENLQSQIYKNVMTFPSMSLTPYILEEREMRVTAMDIFSRLMMDRILWLAGPVNDLMSTTVQAQLLWLNNVEDTDITIYIDSPGGSVKSGLSIVDSFNLSNADIKTVNTGMAASMGSILLGAGTKGKRAMLPNSTVMLHQVSAGAEGSIQDVKIRINEADKYNVRLFDLLGEYCNKKPEEVMKKADRDLWLTSKEALEFGIIDEIITKK
jgi:ATP-dependent Clp protease protease subunit